MKWREIDWWFINLASRSDRRKHAYAEFARHGLPVHRFEAFLPQEWPGNPAKVARMQNRTPGAIGCYQSQTHVIRTVQGSDRVVGVFEDDVVFCDDLPQRLQYIEDHLAWDWDIFYLGATFHVPGQWCENPRCAAWGHRGVDVEPTTDPHILRTFGIWSTYAYLVNGRNVHKVLQLFDENIHRADGIDDLAILLGDRLNTFCFVPGCAKQYDNQSNIGNGITQFSHFASLGPYWFTERMNEFDPRTFNWTKRK